MQMHLTLRPSFYILPRFLPVAQEGAYNEEPL